MIDPRCSTLVRLTMAAACCTLTAARADLDPALRRKALEAEKKAVRWLIERQAENGSVARHPAITALSVTGVLRSPLADEPAAKAFTNKGLDFILSFRQANGSIWVKGSEYPNYTTSLSLIALHEAGRPQDAKAVRTARDFLIDLQETDIPSNNPSYGGVGYARRLRPDMNNTQWALEALYLTDQLDREPRNKDPEAARRADEVWKAATEFISRCQNLPETNDQSWVNREKSERGGFVYLPSTTEPISPAGYTVGEDGEKSPRSYGSMTYAGLKCLIYADVDRDDPRVKAALDWLSQNYTFEVHPGFQGNLRGDKQGLYYYIHCMARCLDVVELDFLKDAEGVQRNWRNDLVTTLLEAQRPDGSWVNEQSGRWMENVPELVTGYTLQAIQFALAER